MTLDDLLGPSALDTLRTLERQRGRLDALEVVAAMVRGRPYAEALILNEAAAGIGELLLGEPTDAAPADVSASASQAVVEHLLVNLTARFVARSPDPAAARSDMLDVIGALTDDPKVLGGVHVQREAQRICGGLIAALRS